MRILTLEDVKNLEWKPRHYREIGGTKYGYDKASHPDLDIHVEGAVVDYVRLLSGLIIPAHYHEEAEETFVVLDGEAIFETWLDDLPTVKRHDRVRTPDMLHIFPREHHRVLNRWEKTLYLVRMAKKKEGDYVMTEPGWLEDL